MRKFDRFMEYCEFKGLTDSQLCKDLKVANGTFYSLRKRKADLSPRLVGIICDTYKDINHKWLLNGEGSMINDEVLITNNSSYLITARLKIAIRELIRKGAIVSQEDLGQKLGYNSEAYFSQLVNGKLSGFSFLEKLKSIFPQVNIDWIKEGKGSCFENDSEMSTLEFSGSVADLISQQNQKISKLVRYNESAESRNESESD